MSLRLQPRYRQATLRSVSPPTTLPQAFLRVLERTPDAPFIRFEDEVYSYAAIGAHVRATAASLSAWGLAKGERVAFYLGNSPSFITAYLGVLSAGGAVVPVNARYRRGELRHTLHDSGARLVVTDGAGESELRTVLSETGNAAPVVVVGKSLTEDRRSWQSLAASGPAPHPELSAEDLAVIAYTSGTTGRAKGAVLTHGNFLSNALAVTAAWHWTASDTLLLTLPLFHMHGLGVGLHGTVVQGSSLTLHRTFDAEASYSELLTGNISVFFGVPTMYARLLEVAKKQRPLEQMRLLVSGSAPLSPHLHAEVERYLGVRILERYGMTETVMNLGNPYLGERRPGSVGVPFPGVNVRIAEVGTDTPLAAGRQGEVQLRGPNICQGYWQRPEATRAAWTADGWFKTGDLGYTGADGYIYLSGRAGDLIITGGFNVYPREVEDLLIQLSGVREVAVVGLPDADLGERVVAAIVGEVNPGAVLEHCARHLAGFKKPKEIHRVPSLPRNALGKVQKHVLREQLG